MLSRCVIPSGYLGCTGQSYNTLARLTIGNVVDVQYWHLVLVLCYILCTSSGWLDGSPLN